MENQKQQNQDGRDKDGYNWEENKKRKWERQQYDNPEEYHNSE